MWRTILNKNIDPYQHKLKLSPNTLQALGHKQKTQYHKNSLVTEKYSKKVLDAF